MSFVFNKQNILRFITLVLIIVGLYVVLPVSGPIILSLLTALFLSPAVQIIMNKTGIKRTLSVILVFTLFLCFLGLSAYVFITQVVIQMVSFIENLPDYVSNISRFWLDIQFRIETAYRNLNLPTPIIQEINNQMTEMLNNVRNQLSSGDLLNNITEFIASIPGYLVTFIVYLIALFLFMLELPRLKKNMYSFMKESTAEKFKFMTARLSTVILGFFKAQLLLSIIIFVVSLIGLYIIAPEVALFMSLIIWLIDFIPIIGSIIVLAPWALYCLITGDTLLGTQLFILAGLLLVIRRTVEPKVMGHHIGLSPLATLISLYIGLTLLGVIGFIFGPLAVIAFSSAREAGIIKMNFKI
ncbi:sporulation integral membrane protein YtvI [Alteribacillus sp. JSM 102045]|uniref:sporulation integral membrane protein YtvI n=1 Tax=Alteribacillus sp. JSM 102045 TaxID=1562101 RepID=UPI0035C12B11